MITGGASGYLRQEFRELELLDEITRLRYDKALPKEVNGNTRNTLIRQFQLWEGTSYAASTHPAIKWGKHDPFETLLEVEDSTWQIIRRSQKNISAKVETAKSNITGFVAAKGTIPAKVNSDPAPLSSKGNTMTGKKRKLEETDNEGASALKRQRIEHGPADVPGPVGFMWDGDNYSCAYDALLSILHTIWAENPPKWKRRFKDINLTMNLLAAGYYKDSQNKISLETARDRVRKVIHQQNPASFPYGHRGTSGFMLAEQLLRKDDLIALSSLRCTDCGDERDIQNDATDYALHCSPGFEGTTADFLGQCLMHRMDELCCHCSGQIDRVTRYNSIPTLLVFAIESSLVRVSKRMKFNREDSSAVFVLRGLVYFGDFHFTSRIVKDGVVWFHDGMSINPRKCRYEGRLSDFTDRDLLTCYDKTAVLVVYARK